MEPVVTATLVMAIATLFLAIAAFVGLFLNRKQLALLDSQFRVQRSLLVPHITVNGVRFENDGVIVELSNSSDAAAYSLRMGARFDIAQPEYYDGPKSKTELSKSRVQQLADEGKIIYAKFRPVPFSSVNGLVYDGIRVAPMGIVNFPVDGLPGAVLFARQHATVRFCPLFGVSALEGHQGKAITFSELREFLLQNDIGFIAVGFDIVYDDVTETPLGGENVDRFAVNLMKHKTLRESWQEHHPIALVPLSRGDIESRLRYMFEDVYEGIRSRRNAPGRLDRFLDLG